MFHWADVVLIYHGRAEGEATRVAEGHEEALHGAMRVGQVVRVARSAVVQPAHEAESGTRSEVCARRSF